MVFSVHLALPLYMKLHKILNFLLICSGVFFLNEVSGINQVKVHQLQDLVMG